MSEIDEVKRGRLRLLGVLAIFCLVILYQAATRHSSDEQKPLTAPPVSMPPVVDSPPPYSSDEQKPLTAPPVSMPPVVDSPPPSLEQQAQAQGVNEERVTEQGRVIKKSAVLLVCDAGKGDFLFYKGMVFEGEKEYYSEDGFGRFMAYDLENHHYHPYSKKANLVTWDNDGGHNEFHVDSSTLYYKSRNSSSVDTHGCQFFSDIKNIPNN